MELFDKLESRYKLPKGLLESVWHAESGGGKYMVSPKGAKGHFGFLDATAKDYGLDNPFDLTKSATAAARYLSDLYKQTGDWVAAIAGYNWGLGNIRKKGLGKAPKETREYVPKVLAGIRQPTAAPKPIAASATPAMFQQQPQTAMQTIHQPPLSQVTPPQTQQQAQQPMDFQDMMNRILSDPNLLEMLSNERLAAQFQQINAMLGKQ